MLKTIFYSLAALVRKILFKHQKIKFISSRHRVISFIYLMHFFNKLKLSYKAKEARDLGVQSEGVRYLHQTEATWDQQGVGT